MLEYFGLSKDDKQIAVSYHPLPQEINPVRKLVEYGEDSRFNDIDIKFLEHSRVEIDAVLAAVGSERLWEYIMHKLAKLFPTRDYNRVISSSPILSEYYPKAIQNFNNYIARYVGSLVAEEQQKIESELQNVEGFIDVEDKRKAISKRLGNIVENDEHLKNIASKLEEMATKEVYDDDNVTTNDDDGSGTGG